MANIRKTSALLLAGDVGGTKTLLGLFAPAPRRPVRVATRQYETAGDRSFEQVVTGFLQEVSTSDAPAVEVGAAAFGVAGPVVDGRCQLTNHPWVLDAAALGPALGAPVRLLNDLEALAYSLDALNPDELVPLQAGRRDPAGPMAVLAAGTGLGAASVVRVGGQFLACPSEAGHCDFGPRNPREDQLVQQLRHRFGRATVEHVLSGAGLVRLHRLTHDGGPCSALADRGAEITPAAVSGSALAERCARCQDALALFVSAYGSEAGNLALRTVPRGGLFIGGGIAPAIRPALQASPFMDAFLDKPPMRALLADIPVHLILETAAGLLGAAVAAQGRLP